MYSEHVQCTCTCIFKECAVYVFFEAFSAGVSAIQCWHTCIVWYRKDEHDDDIVYFVCMTCRCNNSIPYTSYI